MKFEPSEIGEIRCTLNFDEDWYEEYLSDNGLQDSPEVRANYIKENCDYEIEYFDSDTYHSMGEYDTMTLEEIEENFGEAVAADVFRECMDGREHAFEPLAYQNDVINVNNPDEVNAMAVKVLRHGDYFKGCRGFILTNGVVVYTESEHNNCTRITGVKGTSHFIELGNIRVLDHSVDINRKPTPQQIKTLWEVLDSYYGEVLYLDMFDKRIGRFSRQYPNCNPERVMNDINSYFNRRNGIFESVKYLLNKELTGMKKNILKINEAQLRKIVSESVKKVLNEEIDELQSVGGQTVTDPVGYHITKSRNLESILNNGFDPRYIGDHGIRGKGFYFTTDFDERMLRGGIYGDTVIKVKVPGTYQAWNDGNNIVFMVPPEETGNIQIVGYSGPRDFERVFRSV